MNSNVNQGNNYKGRLGCKMKCHLHVFCIVFRDNYTEATEGRRRYSYEKEPVSSDKQIYELISGRL